MPLKGTVVSSSGQLPSVRVGEVTPSEESLGRLALVPAGWVRIVNTDTKSFVDVMLNTAGIQQTGGGARHEISERGGRISVPEYQGHDPIEITLSVVFDGFGRHASMQKAVDTVYALERRLQGERRVPMVRLGGASIPDRYAGRRWFVNGTIEEDDFPTPLRRRIGSGLQLERQALVIPMVEHIPDKLLRESITGSWRTGKGKGSRARTVHAKAGENFGDISKRVYGTRARAADIARANALPLGFKLKKGQKVKLPQ